MPEDPHESSVVISYLHLSCTKFNRDKILMVVFGEKKILALWHFEGLGDWNSGMVWYLNLGKFRLASAREQT